MKIQSENYSDYREVEEEEKNNNFLKGTLYRYFKYWPFILSCLIVALSISFLINSHIPPKYRIESKFLINEEGTSNLFDMNWREVGLMGPKGSRLSNEAIMLKSRPIIRKALDRLNFDVEYFQEGVFANTEIYKTTPVLAEVDWNHSQVINGLIKITWYNEREFRVEFTDEDYSQYVPGEEKNLKIVRPILKGSKAKFAFGDWVELPYARFRVRPSGSERKGSIFVIFRDKDTLLKKFSGDDLVVQPVEKMSSILSLSLKTTQPQKGRDYLNALMDVFLENELDEKNHTASSTIDFIDSQILGLSDSLGFIEKKLENFRSSNRTYNISSEGNEIFGQLAELDKSLAKEQFKKDYYQNLQEYLTKENYHELIVPSGLGIEDPILNTLIENLITLQAEKSRLLATQTADAPPVKEVSRKIADLTTSVKEVLKNVDKNATLVISDLQSRIAAIDTKFSRLPETEQNLLRLERDFSINESIYTFLLQKRAESAISMASNTASNKIIEEAVPDFIPLALQPMLNYILGIVLGLMFSIATIYIWTSLDDRIKDAKELDNGLKVPIIAQIGQSKKHSPLVVMNEPRAAVTEAFRSLRTNINFNLPKGKQLTIMLTSSISGEGKTFCAMNLASVYALTGKKTILVGCDLRKPKLSTFFGVSGKAGLTNYLSGHDLTLSSLIQPTNYPHLDILVEGPKPPNPAELLINSRFEDVMNQLKQQYEVIILDTPPIALVSETLDLVRSVDLTLYMVRYNYSNRATINHINTLKEKMGLNNILAIFNDVENKKLANKGYGYGYFAEDHSKGSRLKKLFTKTRGQAAL